MTMQGHVLRGLAVLLSVAVADPAPVLAQGAGAATAAAPASTSTQDEADTFNTQQLDALLAPIALYPDPLLTQILMASAVPVQVVQALRWLDNPANKALQGDALAKALESQNWDPSVKSLVPFPAVLAMMGDHADWTEELGYAVAVQQADVLDSVQRLRRQAQSAGNLESSPQQVVTMVAAAQPEAPQTIVIQPADPQVVFVPNYNPAQVFGTWPYPAYPPVNLPPPPGYAFGTALATGLAFAAGAAVVGSLWNVGYPNWGRGNLNVNVNRWNNVNVNRPPINNANWRATGGVAGRPGARPVRPAGGPVGRPQRPGGLPAGAIGRPSVRVPGNVVNRPARPGGGGLAGGGAGTNRPGNLPNAGNRPGSLPNAGNRPGNLPNAGNRPGNLPNAGNRPGGLPSAGNRPGPGGGGNAARPMPARQPQAFNGMRDGGNASAFANRGAQSRQVGTARGNVGRGGGGGARAGGAPRGGGGRQR
jgi:uncharacterized membrane protein YgcG